MATTYVDYTATAAQTDFAFSFPYLEDEHVTVEINGVATTLFSIVTTPATKVVLDSGATAGDIVRVRRRSQRGTNLVDFQNGSVLTEAELDRAYLHNRYLAEEIGELNDASMQVEVGGTQWDAKGLRIKNLGSPTDTTDASTKLYVDNKVNQGLYGSDAPLKWQFAGTAGTNTTYTVTGAEISGDTVYDVSINGLVQEPTVDYTVNPDTDTLTINTTLAGGEDIVIIQRGFGAAVTEFIGSNQINNGSVTTAKIATGAVTTAKLDAGAVTTAKLDADAVNGSKIADDSIDSEHYVNGSIDTAHIADDQVTYPKIQNVTTANRVLGSTTAGGVVSEVQVQTAMIADGAVTSDKIATSALPSSVPRGTVISFAGATAPTGYLVCDGSALNTYTYKELHEVISNTYGGTAFQDGLTNVQGVGYVFKLPDLRGRVIAGLDNMGGTSANRLTNPTGSTINGVNGDFLGNYGGHETHLNTAAQSGLRNHKHTVTADNTSRTGAGGPDPRTAFVSTLTGNPNNVLTTGTDASSSHNNVQPTLILNYLIKT
jgi:microcystin-dependent protein